MRERKAKSPEQRKKEKEVYQQCSNNNGDNNVIFPTPCQSRKQSMPGKVGDREPGNQEMRSFSFFFSFWVDRPNWYLCLVTTHGDVHWYIVGLWI